MRDDGHMEPNPAFFAEKNLIQCSTGDSLSCCYVSSNRPDNNDKSVVFNNRTVPVVGVPPRQCLSYHGCHFLGSVGAQQVWNTESASSPRSEATHGPPAPTPDGK